MDQTDRPATLDDFEAYWRICVEPFGTDEIYRKDLWAEYVVFCTNPAGLTLLLEDGALGIVFFMAGIFVTDAFAEEMLQAEEPFVCARFARWLKADQRPFPSPAEIPALNANKGLNLLFVAGGWDPRATPYQQAEYRERAFSRFLLRYGGWQIKSAYAEPLVESFHRTMEQHGYIAVNPYTSYNTKWADPTRGFRPTLYRATKDDAATSSNYGLLRLFSWQAPRCRFNPTQMEIILRAIRGETDAHIAEEIAFSLASIKQQWRRIYLKFEKAYEGVLTTSETTPGKRSLERRRKLVAFLSERMYELRPYGSARV